MRTKFREGGRGRGGRCRASNDVPPVTEGSGLGPGLSSDPHLKARRRQTRRHGFHVHSYSSRLIRPSKLFSDAPCLDSRSQTCREWRSPRFQSSYSRWRRRISRSPSSTFATEVSRPSPRPLLSAARDFFLLTLSRFADHIGGHIKGSRWVPSHQFDEWLPTLLRQLEDTKTVVFHCALSKQRGPSAALQYMREREKQYGAESVAAPDDACGQRASGSSTSTVLVNESGTTATTLGGQEGRSTATPLVQKVCVLRGGFSKWQEAHGLDERLTEAYVKDLWEDY